MSALTDTINTYFALLAIAVVGGGAALIIIHVATATSYVALGTGTAAYAAALLQ